MDERKIDTADAVFQVERRAIEHNTVETILIVSCKEDAEFIVRGKDLAGLCNLLHTFIVPRLSLKDVIESGQTGLFCGECFQPPGAYGLPSCGHTASDIVEMSFMSASRGLSQRLRRQMVINAELAEQVLEHNQSSEKRSLRSWLSSTLRRAMRR